MKVKSKALLLLFAALLLTSCTTKTENVTGNDTKEGTTTSIASVASEKEIELKDESGKILGLKEMGSEDLYMVFWASWCPTCKEELPELEKLKKEGLKGKLILVDLVDNKRENPGNGATYLKENKIGIENYETDMAEAMKSYGLKQIPTLVILDKDKKVVGTHMEGLLEILKEYKK